MLKSRKDKFRPFFFDIQSDKNPFFEVFKVPKYKCILFDKLNEIIRASKFHWNRVIEGRWRFSLYPLERF